MNLPIVYHEKINCALVNCAIIPLRGKGQGREPKQPRIAGWKKFQYRRPSQEELDGWFAGKHEIAYGVVLGSVSEGIFVVDIDSRVPDWLRRIQLAMPEIRETLWVETRRGLHLYFRIKSQKVNASQRFAGGEILGEGSYAVGPGSLLRTDGEWIEYRVVNGTSIIELDEAQLQTLWRVLEISEDQREQGESTTAVDANYQHSLEDIGRYYEVNAAVGVRNKTLYRTARIAQASGYTQEQAERLLIERYNQVAVGIHETKEERSIEAQRTIASAYKKRLKTGQDKDGERKKGIIPNSIREALLRASARKNKQNQWVGGSTVAGRLIEALYRDAKTAEDVWLSAREIAAIAKQYGIGEREVWEVLRGKYSQVNGQPLFVTLARNISHSNQIPPVGDNENNTVNENYKTLLTRYQRQFGKQGRPPQRFYQIPFLPDLCQILNVSIQSADILSEQDLSSASAYRRALYREYLLTGNSRQSTAYLASIWSCHPRSIQLFDHDLAVIKRPRITCMTLDCLNIFQLDIFPKLRTDGISPGLWLEIDGKSYPALRGIALRRLKQGERVLLCKLEGMERTIGTATDLAGKAIYSSMQLKNVSIQRESYKELYQEKLNFTQNAKTAIEEESIKSSNDSGADPHHRLNRALYLIKGLGKVRLARLEQLGIHTLTDLLAAGTILGQRDWPGGYVSEKTVANWIEQAKLLLGWTKESTAETLKFQRRYEQRTYDRDFKKTLDFLKTEISLFSADSASAVIRRLDRAWKAAKEIGTDFYSVHQREKHRIEMIAILESRIQYFQAMSLKNAAWLARWQFEGISVWRKRLLKAERLRLVWIERGAAMPDS